MPNTKILIELTQVIRDAVVPHLGRKSGREVAGLAKSGDATFRIDSIAEDATIGFVRERLPAVACYTEDRGLAVPNGGADDVLVIDPIDGSRPARTGFEACVVSVACAPYSADARFSDVELAVVRGLKDGTLFVAERGRGTEFYRNERRCDVELRHGEQIGEMAWTAELVGRPARRVAEVLSSLIDASALAGGFFVLNSTAYSLTRLVSGQLDAVVDIGGRILEDVPEARGEFLTAGRGRVVALFAYDIAAAVLIAEEAGCVVTDARGGSLAEKPLLDSSEGNLQTVVAATNTELHGAVLSEIEAGFERLRAT